MKKLLLFLAFTSAMMGYSQAGYLTVDAGADYSITCPQPQTLTADYQELGALNYGVESIPYSPPADLSSGTSASLTIDDRWSDIIDLGFTFVYYGVEYTQLVIGANGEVSFNTAYAGGFNEWDLSDGGTPITLPQPNDDSDLAFSTIYGPGHDINPNTCGTIVYESTGTAPTRVFTIKYFETCHFSCGSLQSISSIVLYESTNIVEVNITEKPVCSSWNNGYALIGINNVDGTEYVTPPGRNTSVWAIDTTNSESWRFGGNGTPGSGANIDPATGLPVPGVLTTEIFWTDQTGVVVGTTPEITVTPPATTTYTATVNYLNDAGDVVITISDDIVVTVTSPAVLVDLGPDEVLCDSASKTLDATPSNAADFATITYLWSTGETTPTITATSAGTYSVEVTGDAGCVVTDEIVLEFGITPQIEFLDTPFRMCHAVAPATNDPITVTPSFGNQDTSTFVYEWFEMGSVAPIATTQSLEVTEPGTYTLTVTGGSCSSTATVLVSYYANEFCTYPQGISPNGDQLNEYFDLTWLNDIEGIKNLKFFNRHGTLVYEKDNYSNQFVGNSDDDYELPTGTYFYVLTLADDTVKNGYLYINR